MYFDVCFPMFVFYGFSRGLSISQTFFFSRLVSTVVVDIGIILPRTTRPKWRNGGVGWVADEVPSEKLCKVHDTVQRYDPRCALKVELRWSVPMPVACWMVA